MAKKPPIWKAPHVRVPSSLLDEVDREAGRILPGVELSRTQAVERLLREALDARRAARKGVQS